MPFKTESVTKIKSRQVSIRWDKYIVFIAFVMMFLLFSLLFGKIFLDPRNLLNVLRHTAMISVMAMAGTFVIGCGLIDLSIGAIVALSSLVTAILLRETQSIMLSLVGGLCAGAGLGFVNGVLITFTRLPAFLATMSTMEIIRGIAMWSTKTKAIVIDRNLYNYLFGTGDLFGIPILFFWTALFVIAAFILLRKTAFGKKILAIGGNEIAARFTGVKVKKLKIIVMMISGVCAGMAGILYAGRMQAARFTFGAGDELSVIAAVILGGASLSGGTGSVFGALVGSILMGMINNALIIGGLDVSQQMMTRGSIIIIAIAVSNVVQKRN